MSTASRFVVGFLLVAASARARADEHVLFEVQGNDTLLGTIRPSDEREAILGNLAAGTTLKAAVKSTQKTGPVPTLELRVADTPVDGTQISVKGRGTALAPFVVPASGTYKVVVSGDGANDGDYQLVVNWTPQKAFSGTGTSAGDTTFAFSAPANAVVSIALAAASGSPFAPHLLELDGPGNAVVPLTGGGKAAGVHLPARGDWTLHFRSDAAEGPYKVSVKVASPKVKKHKVDIRDGALAGPFGGASNVIGGVVDPGAGGTVGFTDPGSPLVGASVTVPPGSLGQTTSIFVAAAEPYTPPGSDHPAGPAVEFGPSGTKFDSANPAMVTIPFDAGAFPGGTGALVVYVKDAKGKIEPVLPTSSYVFGANTVTFSTSHFSTFQAATSADRGVPSGIYEALRLTGTPTGHLSGDVGVYTGRTFLQNGTIQGDLSGGTLSFIDEVMAGATIFTSGGGSSLDGTMSQSDDSTTLVDSLSGPYHLRRGITDDVLVVEHSAGLQLGITVLFREVPDRPTLGVLAGNWHAFIWEFKGSSSGGGHVALNASADAGPATITAAGVFQAHVTGNVSRSTIFPGGDWAVDQAASGFVNGTLSFDPDNQLVLKFDTRSELVLHPVLGGDMLFGAMQDVDLNLGPATSQVGLFVLVRDAAGLAAASVLGQCVSVSGGVRLHAADGNPPPDQLGLQFEAQTGGDVLATGNSIAHDSLLCLSGYDVDGVVPVQSTARAVSAAGLKFKLTPDGAFSVPGAGIVGAALPSQSVIFTLQRDSATLAPGFILRLPPPGQ